VAPAPPETVLHYSSLVNGQMRALFGGLSHQTGAAEWKRLFTRALATAKDERLGLDTWSASNPQGMAWSGAHLVP